MVEKTPKWKTIAIMFVAVWAVTLGDLFLSSAMRGLGPLKLESLGPWWSGEAQTEVLLTELYTLVWSICSLPSVWVSLVFMLTFFVLWMVALSWDELTFVMPLTALTYVLNAILVGPWLGEEVGVSRWIGTLLITLGVALVGTEPDGDTNEPEEN